MVKRVWVCLVLLVVLAGCGQSEQEQELVGVRDSVFAAAGVELPRDAKYAFAHNRDPAGCGDYWRLTYEFRPSLYGLELEPHPLDVAERVAEFAESFEGVDDVRVFRYEARGTITTSEVHQRAVNWTTGDRGGTVYFSTVGYIFRTTMIEECPEPGIVAPGQLSLDFDLVGRFGEGTEPGCGESQPACGE